MLERQELEAFVAVAKHLNFARAASELKLTPSQLSKRVGELERKARKKLFSRTTRIVRLTDQGRGLLPAARKAVESLHDARDEFQSSKEDCKVAGRVRITCPHTLAIRKVVPIAAAFHARYPEIFIEFVLNDGYLDLIDGNLDMAVRVMTLEPSSLIARRLAENPIVFCATPHYLKTHPRIKTLADLKKHEVLAISPHLELPFKKCGAKLGSVIGKSWVECMNGDLLVGLAEQGAGVLVRSGWGVEKEVAEGKLKLIELPDQLDVRTAIFAVYPENKYLPRRVRLWIDFLIENYR